MCAIVESRDRRGSASGPGLPRGMGCGSDISAEAGPGHERDASPGVISIPRANGPGGPARFPRKQRPAYRGTLCPAQQGQV